MCGLLGMELEVLGPTLSGWWWYGWGSGGRDKQVGTFPDSLMWVGWSEAALDPCDSVSKMGRIRWGFP